MAGQINSRQDTFSNSSAAEAPSEVAIDLDEDFEIDPTLDLADGDDSGAATTTGKQSVANSTDIRRKLEEKLEVKLLREQLGMDDLDF